MTWITGTPEGLTEADVEVMAYSEAENYNSQGWAATVTLRVPWAKRHLLLSNILDNQLDWPYRPSLGIRATSASGMKGVGATSVDSNKNAYEKADITFTFSRSAVSGGTGTGAPNGGEGNYVFHETLEPNGEMIKLPHEGVYERDEEGQPVALWYYAWGEDWLTSAAVTKEQAPTKLVTGLDYVVHWEALDDVPAQVLTVRDRVNAEEVVSSTLGLTFPAESMLCTAITIRRSSSGAGLGKFDLEVRWSIRYDGWNKFWDPTTGTWEQMFLHIGTPAYEDYSATLYRNYPTTDLFQYLMP